MLNVTLAQPQRHRTLTIFPLLCRDAPELPYVPMSDALRKGTLRITELGSGTVPELLAINEGDASVLILDGENRTPNRSILLPPESETIIPVACMEQGRWHAQSEHFEPSQYHSPSSVRRKSREVETDSAEQHGAAHPSALSSAQGAVWGAIAEKAADLRVRSSTGALDHLYAATADDQHRWAATYTWRTDQVGILAFLGDRPLGMDLIGCIRLYARLHERFVSGYVMDALGCGTAGPEFSEDAAQSYLDRVQAARRIPGPTPGVGSYFVLSGSVIGAELADDQRRAVHLSAFPVDERESSTQQPHCRPPIAPPSRRRRPG
jgi:hypothetical protein